MEWNARHCLRVHSRLSPILVPLYSFVATSLYCLTAERTQLFEKTTKSGDPKTFVLCIGISVFLTLKSWTKISNISQAQPITNNLNTFFLPREQTEEWKGWMQAVILLYHYFGLSNNLPVYQVARVLVAAYMFLTGYSHTSYFLKTQDFSIERTLKSLLRLNILSCTLAYVLNKSWDFYYFPGLTSFWYLVIHATVRCSILKSERARLDHILVGLLVSCVLVQVSLYSDTGISMWTSLLSYINLVGGPSIDAREFTFRLKLDSIVPYWGALLAVFGVWINKDDAEESPNMQRACLAIQHLTSSHTSWTAMAFITSYFLAIQQFKDKFISNAWHPFVSIVPITATLILRNASVRRRQGYNRVFQWLGSISLETYVLQSHVWLTNGNKGLLRVVLFGHLAGRVSGSMAMLPCLLDEVILTTIFFIVSHTTAEATKPVMAYLGSGSKKSLCYLLLACWMFNLHWKKFIE